MNLDLHSAAVPSRTAQFATTHWSVVLAAGHDDPCRTAVALESLCSAYWYPLYAYVRKRGYSAEDAEDLIQQFFLRLLAKGYLARADPHKGRFRSFLLTGVQHFLNDERDKAFRLKRGGGQKALSLDTAGAEARYRAQTVEAMTPEHQFERSWATDLLDRASRRLSQEYAAAGHSTLYTVLSAYRWDATDPSPYTEAAAQLGLSSSAIKSAIRRLRLRHLQLVRDEVARTLAHPKDVDEEIAYLLRLFAK